MTLPLRPLLAPLLLLPSLCLGWTAETAAHSFVQLRVEPKRPMSVAYAVVAPYGVLKSEAWRDGLAVMARSLRNVLARSKHRGEIMALLPTTIPQQDEEAAMLKRLGITPRFVEVPVPLEEVKNAFARMELEKVLGVYEQLKYFGAEMTEYDRVVILDGDTMFLQPIDELFEEKDDKQSNAAALLGIYDHELDVPGSAFPPLNTGFLVFRPNRSDFEALAELVRQGDFREGSGWMGSGTGWTYGTGSQGVLSFYYNQVEPGKPGYNKALPVKGKDMPGLAFTEQPATSRFRPLDRSVYNVIVTELLKEAVEQGRAKPDWVKLFHFTGQCSKPWLCYPSKEPMCAAMTESWWAVRSELASELGATRARCPDWGSYEPLPLGAKEA